jgi:hypothetical protein
MNGYDTLTFMVSSVLDVSTQDLSSLKDCCNPGKFPAAQRATGRSTFWGNAQERVARGVPGKSTQKALARGKGFLPRELSLSRESKPFLAG